MIYALTQCSAAHILKVWTTWTECTIHRRCMKGYELRCQCRGFHQDRNRSGAGSCSRSWPIPFIHQARLYSFFCVTKFKASSLLCAVYDGLFFIKVKKWHRTNTFTNSSALVFREKGKIPRLSFSMLKTSSRFLRFVSEFPISKIQETRTGLLFLARCVLSFTTD